VNVAAWLRQLGLEQYEQAFCDNAVDAEVLPKLTADDLKELGVMAVGHRRKLLDAIAGLSSESAEELASPPVSSATTDPGHRQAAVLFADLVGYTALSKAIDPEELTSSCSSAVPIASCRSTEAISTSTSVTASWPSSVRQWRTAMTRNGPYRRQSRSPVPCRSCRADRAARCVFMSASPAATSWRARRAVLVATNIP
jgi:hypothetical protein